MTVSSFDPPASLKLIAHRLRWQLLHALSRSDFNVGELIAQLGASQNLVSYHLGRLKEEGLVHESRSIADGREVYYSADLGALQRLLSSTGERLHPALGPGAEVQQEAGASRPLVTVLFLCTHNSARSQMAEGLLRQMAGDEVEVFSAGTQPDEIHPLAIEAMDQLGIDIRGQHSKHLEGYLKQEFDYVITVCDRAKESCPVFPGAPEQIHWSFPDPAEVEGSHDQQLKAFSSTAIELKRRISFLLTGIRRRMA